MMICKGGMARRRRKKIGVFLPAAGEKKWENCQKSEEPDLADCTQVLDPPLVFETIWSEGGGQVLGFVLIRFQKFAYVVGKSKSGRNSKGSVLSRVALNNEKLAIWKSFISSGQLK